MSGTDAQALATPEPDPPSGPLRRLQDLGVRFTGRTERWVPDAWVVALLLTIPVFFATLIWGRRQPARGDGGMGRGHLEPARADGPVQLRDRGRHAVATAPIVARGRRRGGGHAHRARPLDLFASIASADTFAPIGYWYSGILNYFVPSGGAKFAIEAPYILPAGESVGFSNAATTMAYAWGDMMSDMGSDVGYRLGADRSGLRACGRRDRVDRLPPLLDGAARHDEDHPDDHQDEHDQARESEHDLEVGHVRPTAAIQNAPAARIDGTHNPTNIPSSRLPANQRPTESRNEPKAARRKRTTPRRRRSVTSRRPAGRSPTR